MSGRVNWSRLANRKRMRRQGVEDVKGATPIEVQPLKKPRRKLSKAELREQAEAALLAGGRAKRPRTSVPSSGAEELDEADEGRPRCPQGRAPIRRRGKALHCLRSMAHPARQDDVFVSLRAEGRAAGPGSPLMPVFRDSKAASGTQPTALPSSPIVPFSWTAVVGCRAESEGLKSSLCPHPSVARGGGTPSPTEKE